MKIKITKKYLTFPVNVNTASKKILISENGCLLRDLDCKLDAIAPTFTAYVDVSMYMGRELDVDIKPYMAVNVGETDEMDIPGYGKEQYRPQIHFTVKNGWNNDPNGLIRFGDRYHMFYQYNPCSNEWANMHWGHAESDDLIHWTEKDVALFPDESGVMYSGSAIEDEKRITPFGSADTPAMLLYYTSRAGTTELSKGKKNTQGLAYSIDGGETFKKYDGNPILENRYGEDRDPKVVWVEELGKYVMAIFRTRNMFSFLTSSDLINWEPYQDIFFEKDRECPDIFCIELDGRRLWVLMGASDYYKIGEFTKLGFVEIQKEKRLNYGRVSYAAQSFSGMPDGRVVKLAWHRLSIPENGFSQQMGIPMEMKLQRVNGEVFLCAEPIEEIKSLYAHTETYEGALDNAVRFDTGIEPLDIKIKLDCDMDAVVTLSIFGSPLTVNMKNKQVRFKGTTMPFMVEDGKLDLRVIVDRCSAEVFACGGKYFFAEMNVCDANLPYVELSADVAEQKCFVECNTLRSIYEV